MLSYLFYYLELAYLYSSGQPKPAYFGGVRIPILDMTGTPLEARKCRETFI
jgi:hypothetical protein